MRESFKKLKEELITAVIIILMMIIYVAGGLVLSKDTNHVVSYEDIMDMTVEERIRSERMIW